MTVVAETCVRSLALRRDTDADSRKVHAFDTPLMGTDTEMTTGLVLQKLRNRFRRAGLMRCSRRSACGEALRAAGMGYQLMPIKRRRPIAPHLIAFLHDTRCERGPRDTSHRAAVL